MKQSGPSKYGLLSLKNPNANNYHPKTYPQNEDNSYLTTNISGSVPEENNNRIHVRALPDLNIHIDTSRQQRHRLSHQTQHGTHKCNCQGPAHKSININIMQPYHGHLYPTQTWSYKYNCVGALPDKIITINISTQPCWGYSHLTQIWTFKHIALCRKLTARITCDYYHKIPHKTTLGPCVLHKKTQYKH